MINFGSNEEFIANYEKLKSSRKMGELYHCDKKTITTHAKKIGYDYSGNKTQITSKYSPEELYLMYEKLGSCKKVGEAIGCSDTAVLNYLNKNGYNLKTRAEKLALISDEEIYNSYCELKSFRAVGEKYNCSGTYIRNRLDKMGKLKINFRNISPEIRSYIIASYQDKTSNELAEELKIGRGTITKIWHDEGLTGKEIKITKTSAKDLTGKTYGFWTVLYPCKERSPNGSIKWHCKCKCGIEKDVIGESLRLGLSLSCGNHSNVSKGNTKIKEILMEAGIPFEIEKKFSTCRDKIEMPFDFFVDNTYLIEYDGIQHFQEGIFDYEYTHAHDLMKNQWCIENNIPLIRIPYTHFKDLCLNDLLLETSNFIEIMPT